MEAADRGPFFLAGDANDDFTMWTTLLFCVLVGFVVVPPFNLLMVQRGKKMGTM